MQFLLQDNDGRPLMIVEAKTAADADVFGRINLPRYEGFLVEVDSDVEAALVAVEGHTVFLPLAAIETPDEEPEEVPDYIKEDPAYQVALQGMGFSGMFF